MEGADWIRLTHSKDRLYTRVNAVTEISGFVQRGEFFLFFYFMLLEKLDPQGLPLRLKGISRIDINLTR